MRYHELTEAAKLDAIFYHGTPVQFDAFDPARAADGHAKEGCGFYFTSSVDDARTYASPSGRVLRVHLRIDRELPLRGRVNVKHVEQLMRASPDLTDVLMNWDENPNIAFRQAVQAMIHSGSPKETFEQVWYDFYRNDPAEYLTNVAKLGYDGTIVSRSNGVTHVVMYNLAKIKIVGVEELIVP